VILEFVANVILSIVGFLISLLPTGTTWSPDFSAVSSVLGSVYAADAYLPITEIFVCMAIALAIMAARWGLTVSLFLYRRIRG
jgi:hypothetical protein